LENISIANTLSTPGDGFNTSGNASTVYAPNTCRFSYFCWNTNLAALWWFSDERKSYQKEPPATLLAKVLLTINLKS